jgi:hypothetical protein
MFSIFPSNYENEEEKEEKSHYIYICKKSEDADERSK